ncbi:reverse transcriptase domain-containing protein, partial [Tanacetum coccineum]
ILRRFCDTFKASSGSAGGRVITAAGGRSYKENSRSASHMFLLVGFVVPTGLLMVSSACDYWSRFLLVDISSFWLLNRFMLVGFMVPTDALWILNNDVGPPGYYTKTDNRPLYGKKRQSLEELLTKHQEESAQRSTEMEVWIKKLQENAEINTRNQSASLKNLETQIEQLTKEIHSDKTLNSSSEQIKTVTADLETSGLNKLHGVSFISGPLKSDTPKVLQHQLPPKELNPGSFILPCTIGKFNFYAMADLGASINVMARSIFEHLHLTNLKKTNMLCEMAEMSKKEPLGIVENVLVKIDKFLFPSDFVIINNTPSETTILGRPFLATIHAKIDVFAGKISLEINENRISFDTKRKDHNYTNPCEKNFMVRPQSPDQSNNQIDYEESGNWDNRSPNLDDRKPKKRNINLDENVPRAHFYNPIKQNIPEQTKLWPSNMEMEPDIENMTMSKYLEYEVAKERRLWDDVRSSRSPTNYN